MMTWWKRTFGLHPVDFVAHFLIGGFIVAALKEGFPNDAISLLGVAGMFAAYAWRRQRALGAFAAEGLTSGEVKLGELDAQAEELHELRTRMAELEERLDFTERLMAQQREPAQIEKP
jgi:hypothetical protein